MTVVLIRIILAIILSYFAVKIVSRILGGKKIDNSSEDDVIDVCPKCGEVISKQGHFCKKDN